MSMPTSNQILLTVDEATRSLKHEGRLILGVEQDHRAERVYFTLPKTIFMDADVVLNNNAVTIKIVYKNASNSTYSQECTSTIVDNGDETITFSWLLTSYVFTKRGNVSFLVWVHKDVYGTDSETSEQVVVESNDWHTTPFIGEVLPGLEITDETIEPITSDSTSYAALMEMINELDAKLDDITGYTEAEIDAMFATVDSNYSTLSQTVSNQGNSISSMSTQVNTNKTNIASINNIKIGKVSQSASMTGILVGNYDALDSVSGSGKTFETTEISNSDTKVPTSNLVYNAVKSAPVEDTTWKDSNTDNKNEDGSIRVRGINNNDYTYFDYPDTGFYRATINLTNLYDVTQNYQVGNEEKDDDPGVVLEGYTLPVQGLIAPGRDCYMTCSDIYGIDDKVGLLLEKGYTPLSINKYEEGKRYFNNSSILSESNGNYDSITAFYTGWPTSNTVYAINVPDVDSIVIMARGYPAKYAELDKTEEGWTKFTLPAQAADDYYSAIHIVIPSTYKQEDIIIIEDAKKSLANKMIAKLRVWKRNDSGQMEITHRITGTITGLYKVTI